MNKFPTYKTFLVNDLIPYARNSRTHSEAQVTKIAASIKEFGFLNPVIVDGENGIVAGHGRIMAAKKLGMEEVPVIEASHLTDAQRRAYVIADNRLALDAEWDDEMLRVEFAELEGLGFDLDLTGFTPEEIAALEPEQITAGLTDEDAVPEVPVEPVTRLGDIWVMGKHRLMCGDSTSIDAVDALMDGDIADIIVFDPPYEVENLYQTAMPKNSSGQKILVFWDFKRFATAAHAAICAGWTPQYEFVWDNVTSWYTQNRPLARHKSVGVFGDDPTWNFDAAIIRDGKNRNAKQVWNTRGEYSYTPLDGAVHMRTVESFPTTAESGGHSHSKPMPWIEALFNGVGGSVYIDLFGGSGSTLIACEKTSRVARLMELDPKYCDVIVKRWQDFTGNQATLESTGQTFAEVSNVSQTA